MTAQLWKTASSNGFNTSLNGSITDSAITITLSTTTGLQEPGVLVIDRVDSSGNKTPSLREYITYTGISGNDLTGVTRGVSSSTAQSHNSGAKVEEVFSVKHWMDLYDFLLVAHSTDGTLGSITATSVTSDTVTAETTNASLKLKGNGTGVVNSDGDTIEIVVVDYTTDLATGDGKAYVTIPKKLNGMNLDAVHARVITAGTTGTTDIQIHNVTDAADMLSTVITIDSTETGSDTAATAAVINTATDDVATNDLLRIDIDAISTTAPKGLILRLEFRNA